MEHINSTKTPAPIGYYITAGGNKVIFDKTAVNIAKAKPTFEAIWRTFGDGANWHKTEDGAIVIADNGGGWVKMSPVMQSIK